MIDGRRKLDAELSWDRRVQSNRGRSVNKQGLL
jgi:hypothetical protein